MKHVAATYPIGSSFGGAEIPSGFMSLFATLAVAGGAGRPNVQKAVGEVVEALEASDSCAAG